MRRKLAKLPLIAAAVLAVWPASASTARHAHAAPQRAHDFERPLPTLQPIAPLAKAPEPGRGAVAYRSAPITAPHTFDAVGIAGVVKPVEFRSRSAGNGWSHWVETDDGNPVYTGGSDELQVRSRGWEPSGRLHYVSVPPGSVPKTVTKAEKSDMPALVSRKQWGADNPKGGCLPRTAPITGTVKAAVVHHTVSTNKYTEAQAPGIVLAICRFHKNGNGWNDIGYNALADRFGNIYVGRAGGIANPVVGAQAQGFNSQTTGIASIGTYTDALMPQVTMQTIARYLAWKLPLTGMDAAGHSTLISAGGDLTPYPAGTKLHSRRIVGHQRLDSTACPGAGAKSQLPHLRDLVQALIDQAPPVGGPSHHRHRHRHRHHHHRRGHGGSGGVTPG